VPRRESTQSKRNLIKDNGNARSREDIEADRESGVEEEWKKRLHRP
jgi:hypothetical protein